VDFATGEGAFAMHRDTEAPFQFLEVREPAVIGKKMHHDAIAVRREYDIRERAQAFFGLPGFLDFGAA
jgi:hypothetical protein